MIKCPFCGSEIHENAVVCIHCGKNLTENNDNNDKIYYSALSLMSKDDISSCENAIKEFESIIDWKDSRTKIDECYKRIETLNKNIETKKEKNKNNSSKAIKALGIISVCIILAVTLAFVYNKSIKPKNDFNKVLSAIEAGNFDLADDFFKEYSDNETMQEKIGIVKVKLAVAKLNNGFSADARSLLSSAKKIPNAENEIRSEADNYLKSQEFEKAYILFEALDDTDGVTEEIKSQAKKSMELKEYDKAISLLYIIDDADGVKEGKYRKALQLVSDKEYIEAYELLEELSDYKDSQSKAKSITSDYYYAKMKQASVGDSVYFGQYEQYLDEKSSKDILWLVLAKENNRVLLVSRDALDCKPYNNQETNVTWETCSLRQWLNNEFFKKAFSAKEQKKIKTVTVKAEPNPSYSTNAGKDTKDKIFLLSISEIEKYLSNRECSPTNYAIKNGARAYSEKSYLMGTSAGNCEWWTRSPGDKSSKVFCVSERGGMFYVTNEYLGGNYVDNNKTGVRPAMWVDLSDTD